MGWRWLPLATPSSATADDRIVQKNPVNATDDRNVQKTIVNATRISPQMAKVADNATKTLINDTSISPPKAEAEKLETRKVELEQEQPLCVSEARTEYCQPQGDIRCTKYHSIPAVIFSTAGYTGNHFHEFSDIVIPLFLTCRLFNGQVQLIITDKKSWWISKHQAFLKKLSNYEIIDIDRDDEVHCFSKVIIGLKRYHKELSIDPQKYSYSIKDFMEFLRSSYSLKRVGAIKIRDIGNKSKKPRLLILSRKTSRSFINTNQITKMAKGLGFRVIVHGAGLTNILFLPQNAIFIQVVPFGGMQVEWLATNDFARPLENMNIKYLEYKIRLEESTLIQQYPLDHMGYS
ncbi:alpha-1,3-arabinosyltransferase XAT3 [Medicago truncatula]|uniref:alpha-1,3-arabinosyltransferase XAT3 n=1 Tax=Medicago truncatula TaxID=3880 RepID=UPI001967ED1B|nr:alpha-1,3-arabinosyltransferase XAT3 [Medicago truncatula]